MTKRAFDKIAAGLREAAEMMESVSRAIEGPWNGVPPMDDTSRFHWVRTEKGTFCLFWDASCGWKWGDFPEEEACSVLPEELVDEKAVYLGLGGPPIA